VLPGLESRILWNVGTACLRAWVPLRWRHGLREGAVGRACKGEEGLESWQSSGTHGHNAATVRHAQEVARKRLDAGPESDSEHWEEPCTYKLSVNLQAGERQLKLSQISLVVTFVPVAVQALSTRSTNSLDPIANRNGTDEAIALEICAVQPQL
jgi:hypothetical protein